MIINQNERTDGVWRLFWARARARGPLGPSNNIKHDFIPINSYKKHIDSIKNNQNQYQIHVEIMRLKQIEIMNKREIPN